MKVAIHKTLSFQIFLGIYIPFGLAIISILSYSWIHANYDIFLEIIKWLLRLFVVGCIAIACTLIFCLNIWFKQLQVTIFEQKIIIDRHTESQKQFKKSQRVHINLHKKLFEIVKDQDIQLQNLIIEQKQFKKSQRVHINLHKKLFEIVKDQDTQLQNLIIEQKTQMDCCESHRLKYNKHIENHKMQKKLSVNINSEQKHLIEVLHEKCYEMDLRIINLLERIPVNAVAPSIGGNAVAPSIGGNAVAPSIGGNAVAPSIGGNAVTPSIGGNAVAPSIEGNTIASSIGCNAVGSVQEAVNVPPQVTAQ